MRRLDRLCLDAVERLGPKVPSEAVVDYVCDRRWMLGAAAVYVALRRLEATGFVVGDWSTTPVPWRGWRPRRLYSVPRD